MEEREGTHHNNNNIPTSFGLKQQHEAPAPAQPTVYHMDPPRSENPNPFPVGPTPTAATSENVAPPFSLTMPVENSSAELKKKRGRPRKYNPDGSLAVTLSPMPISSSVPLERGRGRGKGIGRGRGRGRGRGLEREEHNNNMSNNNISSSNNWLKNPQMFEFDNSSGRGTAEFVDVGFTPHVLTVNTGEDVTMKIMTFSQQGARAICILSANGPISNVTLRQSMTSGGTLTYEGHFEILSLTGSFIPSESGGARSRAGGMSVSLAAPDGRVFGGGLAGLFVAGGPVQVMVGSFKAGQEEPQQQQQIKKQRERVSVPATTQTSNISFGGSVEDPKARFGIHKPPVIQAPPVSVPPVSFSHEPNTNTVQNHNYYANNTANHINDLFSSLPGEYEDDDEEDLEGEEDEDFGGHSESDTEIPN